jgi:hypothetical protein
MNRPLTRRGLALRLVSLVLGLIWLAWTLTMLLAGNGDQVERSVHDATETARAIKSWPLSLAGLALVVWACVRMYRHRQWAGLALVASLAVSLQARRWIDYSDRTLTIVVLAEVAAAMVINALLLVSAWRSRGE